MIVKWGGEDLRGWRDSKERNKVRKKNLSGRGRGQGGKGENLSQM